MIKVFRLYFVQQLKTALAIWDCVWRLVIISLEAQGFPARPPADDLVQADECAATDEENVGGIYRGEFLVWVLAPALRRNVGDCSFQYLQKCLLHACTRYVAGDGRILVFAADLIHFVDVDDSGLCPAYIAIRCLEQLQNNVLYVFADVSRFGQSSRVHNCEGHVQHARERLRHQGLSSAGRTYEHDVRLCELNAVPGALPVHVDAFVVVVNRDGELLLGLLLSNHVLVEEGLDLVWLRELVRSGGRRSGRAVIFQNGIADRNTLVANVRPAR